VCAPRVAAKKTPAPHLQRRSWILAVHHLLADPRIQTGVDEFGWQRENKFTLLYYLLPPQKRAQDLGALEAAAALKTKFK